MLDQSAEPRLALLQRSFCLDALRVVAEDAERSHVLPMRVHVWGRRHHERALFSVGTHNLHFVPAGEAVPPLLGLTTHEAEHLRRSEFAEVASDESTWLDAEHLLGNGIRERERLLEIDDGHALALVFDQKLEELALVAHFIVRIPERVEHCVHGFGQVR